MCAAASRIPACRWWAAKRAKAATARVTAREERPTVAGVFPETLAGRRDASRWSSGHHPIRTCAARIGRRR